VVDADYNAFLRSKVKLAERTGFDVEASEINPVCKDHQRAIVRWLVAGGCRACFAAFGLGKTIMELETARLMLSRVGGRALIVLPLGVRQEFRRDAVDVLGMGEPPLFVRTLAEVEAFEHETLATDTNRIFLTNYESVRDGKLDPADFQIVCLDEASILRGFGGTKTFREMMRLCTGDGGPTGRHRTDGKRVPHRFVATATPAPNDYIELLAYAEFLGIMDISQAKTRFFKRDSTKADNLTLHPHKAREFWLWVSSWAIFVQRPSDLGFSDEGYELPDLDVRWHEVPTDHSDAGKTKSGQIKLFRNAAIGVQDAAAEKRISLPARIAKMMELRAEDPLAHRLLWHDLEAERHAIEKALREEEVAGSQEPVAGDDEPAADCGLQATDYGLQTTKPWASIYGSQDLDEREQCIIDFSNGLIRELAAKPVIAGSGCNFQRHCAWAIFLGIGFKFNDFIQAIHRIQRFMQTRPVRIDLIYTEAESEVKRQLETKWQQHNEMVASMTQIIREFGLSHADMAAHLTRKMGTERIVAEESGRYRLVNNDCVVETRSMPDNSVHLVLTSIPFSTQYEYSPNYADFGHSEGNSEFFDQMDFLSPELLRVLAPGRIFACHVKDRIVPGGLNGLGFQTVYPFHARCIEHYARHGFAYMGMITVVTDVVRENNQTYRLSWTRQCTDATCMGVGMPEYVLLFRKPTSDRTSSYADVPVVKSKTDYSRARWQTDAHAYWRSSGDRSLTPQELAMLPHREIFRWHREYSLQTVYDFEHHVRVGEELELAGRLPTTFMLLQPQSHNDGVWADVTRMRTLNGVQHAKGRQMHLCPLQFDICDRIITRFSMPGETVYDPFAGLATVPYRAVQLGRFGLGCELNHAYWLDGCSYCRSAVAEMRMPSLFDVQDEEPTTEDAEDTETEEETEEVIL